MTKIFVSAVRKLFPEGKMNEESYGEYVDVLIIESEKISLQVVCFNKIYIENNYFLDIKLKNCNVDGIVSIHFKTKHLHEVYAKLNWFKCRIERTVL